MNIWQALTIRIRLKSAGPEELMSKLTNCGIALLYINREDDITTTISVKPADYKNLISLLHRWQIEYSVYEDSKVNRVTQALKRRLLLKFAVLILFAVSMYLPGRVLFVAVSGNNTVPAREILEAATAKGVCFSARSADIRSEKVKNYLLEMIPELQWAGVNITGCVATIQVEEKPLKNNPQSREIGVVSIVASGNGIVKSCTATQGTLLCGVGQAVKEGETLISGYTDCGIVIKATQAQGEVYALTAHTIEAVTPAKAQFKGDPAAQEVRYSLKIGKKLINFNNSSGIYQGTCAKIYEEYFAMLPDGFTLPFSIQKETIVTYQADTADAALWSNEKELTGHVDQFLINQMVAGEIDDSYIFVETSDHLISVRGHYICTEMIGRKKTEQFTQGEFYSD